MHQVLGPMQITKGICHLKIRQIMLVRSCDAHLFKTADITKTFSLKIS